MGSEKLFRKDCTRVQFPIWLRGSVHISVHVLRRVAAGISSSLCIKRHSFGQFHSLTYINRWCWLLHKHIFFFLPPSTVPCWIVLTSPDDRAMKFWGGFTSVAQHNLCALLDTNTVVLVLCTLLTTSNL